MIPLVYFQSNTDGTHFDLDRSSFEPYMTTNLTGRAAWFTRLDPGKAKSRWN